MAIKIAGVDVINDDRELVLAKLTDINETINDTAVDVFIYDTSKDSDGGAWRHRTQHTSWYNEGASNIRGCRKEFPAVAVIVVESNKVTIYDGDDPSLPMWMVFNTTGIFGGNSYNSCAAVNGILVCGTDGGWGAPYCNFPADFGYHQWNSAAKTLNGGGIADRNVYTPITEVSDYLVNNNVNDVAMTVLPDAPTDPATGLPVPTIDVFTAGGVSRIQHDGLVVDVTNSAGSTTYYPQVGDTNKNNRTAFNVANVSQGRVDIGEIPSTDVSGNPASGFKEYAPYAPYINPPLPGGLVNDICAVGDEWAIGTTVGFTFLAEDPTTPANGMVAYTTSSYNTGWMPGSIKLAALADTTAETLGDAASGATVSDPNGDGVYDGELIKNGGFATDADWTDRTGGSNNTLNPVEITGGELVITQGSNSVWMGATQGIDVTGVDYVVIEAELISRSTAGPVRVGLSTSDGATGAPNLGYMDLTEGDNTVTLDVSSVSTAYLLVMDGQASGANSHVDNISVRLADPDRSVNGNGLGVHGSITKTAVATGADVVGYSGFSTSNYLEQPYNPDLDFGTGDFCVMGWAKLGSNGSTRSIFQRYTGSSGAYFDIYQNVYDRLVFRCYSDQSFSYEAPLGSWVFFAMRRDSGVFYAYVNGTLVGSGSSVSSLSSAGAVFTAGNNPAHDTPLTDGSLALLRISATAPTADQIRKIYEDERPLFQPNAKATLTGNSDAVTALAYDHDTNLLHVGTSGGRSVFQGLRRVEEHTGTNSQSLAAISAVDGLVVEGK